MYLTVSCVYCKQLVVAVSRVLLFVVDCWDGNERMSRVCHVMFVVDRASHVFHCVQWTVGMAAMDSLSLPTGTLSPPRSRSLRC